MSDASDDYRHRVPTPDELEARQADQAPKGLRRLLSPRRKLRVARHVAAENRATSQSSVPRPRASSASASTTIRPGETPRFPTEEEIEKAALLRKQKEAGAAHLHPGAESKQVPPDRADAASTPSHSRTRRKILISNEVRHARGLATAQARDQKTEEEWQPKWPHGLSMEEMHRRIGAQQSYLDDID